MLECQCWGYELDNAKRFGLSQFEISILQYGYNINYNKLDVTNRNNVNHGNFSTYLPDWLSSLVDW